MIVGFTFLLANGNDLRLFNFVSDISLFASRYLEQKMKEVNYLLRVVASLQQMIVPRNEDDALLIFVVLNLIFLIFKTI